MDGIKKHPASRRNEPPHIVRTVQKRGLQGVEQANQRLAWRSESGGQASLCLEPLVVIEVDVLVDQIVGLLKCLELLAVDAFCFQDTEKIFGHCVVIAVSRLDMEGVMP